jgi:hypothetical protein
MVSAVSAHADHAAGRSRRAPNLDAIDIAVERAQKPDQK